MKHQPNTFWQKSDVDSYHSEQLTDSTRVSIQHLSHENFVFLRLTESSFSCCLRVTVRDLQNFITLLNAALKLVSGSKLEEL